MSRWEDIYLNEIQHQVTGFLIKQKISSSTATKIALGVKWFVDAASWLFL